jgi:hypothetical protein
MAQFGAAQVGFAQVAARQIGSGQIAFFQILAGKISAGEIGALAAGMPLVEFLVGVQDVLQFLTFVSNGVFLSQPRRRPRERWAYSGASNFSMGSAILPETEGGAN